MCAVTNIEITYMRKVSMDSLVEALPGNVCLMIKDEKAIGGVSGR